MTCNLVAHRRPGIVELRCSKPTHRIGHDPHPHTNRDLYANSNPQNVIVIMGFLIYPLSPLDRTSFDVTLSNPDSLLKGFATGLAGKNTTLKSSGVIPNSDKLGDRSMGVTIVSAGDAGALQLDTIIVRTGSTAQVIYAAYPSGTTPSVSLVELARTLDGRVKTVLGSR